MALRKWRVRFTATLACIALAFTLGDRCAIDKPPLVDEVCPKVVIRGKDFFVPEHYPYKASGKTPPPMTPPPTYNPPLRCFQSSGDL